MKIKKNFSYKSKKQIWRLLPTDTGKLIIEERDAETKQVYFNCFELKSGKSVLKNLQLEKKFWIGIETVHDDIIYFHKFIKPDLPQHKGIIAYSINQKKQLWQTDEYNFLFFMDDILYTYKQLFDGRKYYSLKLNKENISDEKEISTVDLNSLRKKFDEKQNSKKFIFPATLNFEGEENEQIKKLMSKLRDETLITGNIQFAVKDNLLMLNFHRVLEENFMQNNFKIVDLVSGKFILEEVLDKNTNVFVSDSFFIMDEFLFLLKGRNTVIVYSIK